MKTKPNLNFWKLWDLSFGFFGVQIAYSLKTANVSRIFTTIGADPHDLSYFWILPPLMGLLVQPLVGMLSDKTWTRFGRRIPYLMVGAAIAVIVMCMLPNSGSFHLSVSTAILFGLIALMLLDTSINMAMQPFKMLVGDMVNEEQKGKAYSIQSFLCNAGSIIGYALPFCLVWLGLKNVAPSGEVPQTVVWSFYIGAAVLLGCVVYSMLKIKEWPPEVYNEYNGIEEKQEKKNTNLIKLLINAPKTFWTVGLVQFFCWFAFLFLWTYAAGTVATKAFNTPSVESIQGVSFNDKEMTGHYILANDSLIIEKGMKVSDYLSTLTGPVNITVAGIYSKDSDGITTIEESETFEIPQAEKLTYVSHTVLDAGSEQYNEAGNWLGLLYAVQALGSVVWALALPRFKSRRFSYMLSLLLGAAGFLMLALFTNQWLEFLSFLLIGCAWSAMLAWPFTILTNSIKGGNIGSYLGLFNCTICIPQIVAALLGGWILSLMSTPGTVAPEYKMMIIAAVVITLGAISVLFIKEDKSETPVETPVISEDL